MNTLRNLGRFIASHPLTADAQFGAWTRFASWHIRSRLSDEVIVPWVGGQHLVLRRGMTGATGNIYVGLQEFMGMMLVLHLLREGDVFLDVGANVGSYTVLASGVCRATTWAFEPDLEALQHLKRHIEINELDSLVFVYPIALGQADGEVPMTVEHGAANRVDTARSGNVHVVAQRPLDNVIGDARPIMIKLDVEGYEEEVLRGAQKLIGGPSLKVISQEGTTPWMLKLLADHGFERAFYDPFTHKLQRTPNSLALSNGKWTLSNEFFVRDWEFVEARLATAKPVTILGHTI